MPDVFEGPADGRQSADPAEPVSRFRPRYRPLTNGEKALHDEIKEAAVNLEALIERIDHGRYKALAITDLERAVMWAVKGLTA